MIPKNDFINAVNAIREVDDFYGKFGQECNVQTALVRTLMDAVGDKYEWIDWWICDTDYGTRNPSVKSSRSTPQDQVIDTVDKLYDFVAEYYAKEGDV